MFKSGRFHWAPPYRSPQQNSLSDMLKKKFQRSPCGLEIWLCQVDNVVASLREDIVETLSEYLNSIDTIICFPNVEEVEKLLSRFISHYKKKTGHKFSVFSL